MFLTLPRRATAVVGTAGLALSGAAILALAPSAHADAPTPACNATTCSLTYEYSGQVDTFTVPDYVSLLQVDARGASDASGTGAGGETKGTLTVTPNSSVAVLVGQRGRAGDTVGTFGGGGPVSAGSNSSSGGGGTFVFGADQSLALAAGGGGGANFRSAPDGTFGGSGGGLSGGTGNVYESSIYTNTPAGPGTQSAPGSGGYFSYSGGSGTNGTSGTGPATTSGNPGKGGTGGTLPNFESGGGGGGGGGYYGGGGGGSWGQSGSGGSGFVSPSATEARTVNGVNVGDGKVTFTWPMKATTTTLAASPQSTGAFEGDSVTLTATVTSDFGAPDGVVAFADGGTTIGGCDAVAVDASGTADCTTTFTAGTHALVSSYSGSSEFAATSGTLSYEVTALPTITTSALSDATYGADYTQTLSASGGIATPYTFSVSQGALPAGLQLVTAEDGKSATITGKPTGTPATSTFSVTISDGTRSTEKSLSLTVEKAAQSADFSFAPDAPVVGDQYAIPATTGGGSNDLVFAGNAACSVDGRTVTFLHADDCTVTATRSGDDNYSDAEQASHTVTVGKAAQTLADASATPVAEGTVGGSSTITYVGGGSSEPVGIAVTEDTTNEACSITSSTSEVVDGRQRTTATLSFDRIGSCALKVTQAGDDDYTDAAAADQSVEVGGKPTTTSVVLSTADAVHNQLVTATATVTGTSAGTVYFAVDGRTYDREELVPNTDGTLGGTATSTDVSARPIVTRVAMRSAMGAATNPVSVGAHQVTATFVPEDDNTFADSGTPAPLPLTVTPSHSTVTVSVEKDALVATVTVDAPSRDVPTGSVTFTVGDKPVGTAEIADGVARLAYSLPAGSKKTVSASYVTANGQSGSITPSTGSTARKDPTLTATTPARGKSAYGWYSRPVVVRFHCTAGSAAVVACPAPVTVSRGGVTTISRTVHAKDGGVATTSVTVKLDRRAPSVAIGGVVAGRVYPAALPKARCVARDATSGIAACALTRSVRGTSVTYRARAVDRAGNVSRSSVTIRRSPIYIVGADYSGALPVVKLGKGYTITYTGKGTPHYIWAAPKPTRPKGDGGAFTKTGKHQWSFGVVFTTSLHHHEVWSFGVKVGTKTYWVQIRVVK